MRKGPPQGASAPSCPPSEAQSGHPAPGTTSSLGLDTRRRAIALAGMTAAEGPASQLQQEAPRVLQVLLDPHQEGYGVTAIDDAVVVAERQVHDRPRHDLAVAHDRLLLDAVHAE